jgi:multidrug efflux pump subunit AcrA (membrane-fusion protein)
MAEFNLKRARNSLEYTEEELRQLEKMYAADEVTEETEAIVLKRARDQVESAKMMVESAQMARDHDLNFDIPRTDDRTKDTSQRRELEIARAKISLPEMLKRQQIEVEKQRVQHARSAERLKMLAADRELLTVRSPIEGVVYYGKCTRGKFGDSQSLADALRPAGMVQMNQVLMTVVQPQVMTIRASIPEDQLHRLRPGLSGVAMPSGFPEQKLAAALSQWSEIPIGPGSFDATLQVNLDKTVKTILPGMACKVKLTAYAKKDALVLPAGAVLTDELDDHRYVYLLGKDGKTSKRDVTVGEKTDKVVEIVKGLVEGDQVLQEAPKDGK